MRWRQVQSALRAVVVLAACALFSPHAAAVQRTGFDHLTTGYELQGAHRDLSCEFCHVNGVFKGTPRTCQGCHTIGSRISATPKPPTHIATFDNCAQCHALYNFTPIFRMDHLAAKGACVSCHNGVTARGKKVGHITSDNVCGACHTTNAFLPAVIDHNHLVALSVCSSCHNGIQASAKSLTHIPTSSQCGTCHSTLSWTPARVDHSMLTTNCQSCHNGASATGKVANHAATTKDCSTCHRYPHWTPVTFVHSSPQYPGEHSGGLACSACHASSLDQANWPVPAYRPDCAGCHASAFKAEAHQKTTHGLNYTVAELRNCTGACHVYEANLTRIAKPRPPGHHKVSDGAFK